MGRLDELLIEFSKNKSEEVFKEIVNSYEDKIDLAIRYRLPSIFYGEHEDIKQQVLLAIWRYGDRFNPEIAKAKTYLDYITKRRVITFIRLKNYGKRLINQESSSLDNRYCNEDKDRNFYTIIPNGDDVEKEVIDGIYYRSCIDDIKYYLTDMELEILESFAPHLGNGRFDDNSFKVVMEETGYSYKQIDNAIYRIKSKAHKLDLDLNFIDKSKYDDRDYKYKIAR